MDCGIQGRKHGELVSELAKLHAKIAARDYFLAGILDIVFGNTAGQDYLHAVEEFDQRLESQVK